MDRSGLQRLIPIALVLIVVVIAIAALVSLGRALFSGGGEDSGTTPPPVNTGKQALTSATADRSVRMTARGPLVADENFYSYTITVAPDKRNMTTYKGYAGEQIETSQLSNTMQAYEQFVHALDRANLMEGEPLSGDANDTRGVCATGTVYAFEVLQGTNTVRSFWTSTCKGSQGSLEANLQQVAGLFRRQIPDYSKLVRSIDIS